MKTLVATTATARPEPRDAGWAAAFLDELMARVGVDGLVAALRSPALMATVDFNAAQVRESLAGRGLGLGREALAGYGAVLLTAAQYCGRLLPADPGAFDWDSAEWYLLRLVAVCALADEIGCL
jgi:hypothetical protein